MLDILVSIGVFAAIALLIGYFNARYEIKVKDSRIDWLEQQNQNLKQKIADLEKELPNSSSQTESQASSWIT
jgi:hypothetical protein